MYRLTRTPALRSIAQTGRKYSTQPPSQVEKEKQYMYIGATILAGVGAYYYLKSNDASASGAKPARSA